MTPSEVSSDLWARLGGAPAGNNAIRFAGPDTVLPSILRVTDFAAGCVAVATAAAGILARRQGWSGQLPTISTTGASAVFRSERYLRRNGKPFTLWDEISGYYRCADDRWIQLHCNFAHHRQGVIATLGCPDSRPAVEAAIAENWGAQELEDELVGRDMVAAMLLTRDEWLEHPQGRAVSELPLLEIERIGDAPPRNPSPPTAERPLADTRVLDLTRIIAGPTCGRVLASHGADVLRIGAAHVPTVESCVVDTGFGKRAVNIDLADSADRTVMETLLADADVFVDGFRPGALEAHGYGRDDVADRAPGIVHVSLSAYGHRGPWAARRGFDSLTQTASGIGAAGAAAAGVEATRPLPCQALDHGTGWLLAAATMVALERQHAEGGTWMVRGSLAQTGHYLWGLGKYDTLHRADPTAEDLAARMVETSSEAWGQLTHVAAQGRLDGVTRYDSAPVPIGSSVAGWRSVA